jgi:hypothetical protein
MSHTRYVARRYLVVFIAGLIVLAGSIFIQFIFGELPRLSVETIRYMLGASFVLTMLYMTVWYQGRAFEQDHGIGVALKAEKTKNASEEARRLRNASSLDNVH